MKRLKKSMQLMTMAVIFFISCGEKPYDVPDMSDPGLWDTQELYNVLINKEIKNNKYNNPQRKKNSNRVTPLMAASSLNRYETMISLLKKNRSVNKTDKMGRTALFYAILSDDIDSAKILIKNGANVNHRSNDNLTPLMYGASLGNLNMVKLLVSSGGRISDKGRFNELDAFWWASRYDYKDVMEYLKEKSSKIKKLK